MRVIATCDRQREQVTFQVTDTGIGMTAEQMRRIFQPFGQADASTTRKFGGTGLGLTITQRVAKLLGGDIRVDSEPGIGSTFTLTIGTGPLEGVQMLTSSEATRPRRDTPGSRDASSRLQGRILLVEDGVDNQKLISVVLKKAGADVTIANNGQEGVEQVLSAWKRGEPFHVVLMDMQMPIMDGYEATEVLREAGYDAPIVALTAHAMKHDIDKCLQAGCDAYLSKPIDRTTFIAEIAAHIERARGATDATPVGEEPETLVQT